MPNPASPYRYVPFVSPLVRSVRRNVYQIVFRGETLVGVCGIGMRSLVQSYRSRFSVPSATV